MGWPRPTPPKEITGGGDSLGRLLARPRPTSKDGERAAAPVEAAAPASHALAPGRLNGSKKSWSVRDRLGQRPSGSSSARQPGDVESEETLDQELDARAEGPTSSRSSSKRRLRKSKTPPPSLEVLTQRQMLAVLQTLAHGNPEARDLLRSVAAQLDELRTQNRLRRMS